MALLKDLDEFDRVSKVGDWCFVNGETHIAIRLGEDFMKSVCILPILKNGSIRDAIGISWTWNGSKEFPTLNPSILHWGNGKSSPATWHGYMKNGILESC